jgi:four helix bundle protein
MKGRGYRDLEAWQKAMDLAVQCCRSFKCSHESDAYVLATLILRAAVAVPSSIAQAYESDSKGGSIRHLSAAGGSLAKLETQIEIAQRVEYVSLENARRMLALAEVVENLVDQLLCRAQSKGPGPMTQDRRPPISNN